MHNSKIKYLFDVDGTLTDSRQIIDTDFKQFFISFCKNNEVYLVTGSDYVKTEEQLGKTIMHLVKLSFNCSGNDIWSNGVNVRTSSWKLPNVARQFLENYLTKSNFSLRTGNHIEQRPGTVNFSVVGRNADVEQRADYKRYDQHHLERNYLVRAFNTMFPELQATIGGDTGIDIAPRGADKSQILSDFKNTDKLLFVGDKCAEGGNDYTIAKAIAARSASKNSFAYGPGKFYNTEGWEQTWEILKRC